jgi:hypothetical protein
MAYDTASRQVHRPFSRREMDRWLNFDWEGHVPGSGQLGILMSDAFGLPHSTVTTVIKALRSDRVLSIKGRGSSAAQMTIADAGAIMVGIMSGAVSAEIPALTKRLLQMPSRHFVRPASALGLRDLLTPVSHTFLDGFCALFEEGWHVDDRDSDAEKKIACVRIMLGVDGSRTEGFAVIEAQDSHGTSIKNYYATLGLRAGILADEAPEGLGLRLYHAAPRFIFAASVEGPALAALKRALVDPVSERRTK